MKNDFSENPSERNTPKEALPVVTVEYDPSHFGKGLHQGTRKEFKYGYAFYELHTNPDGSNSREFVTVQPTSIPTLTAVTKEQYQAWSKAKLEAVPVIIRWDGQQWVSEPE